MMENNKTFNQHAVTLTELFMEAFGKPTEALIFFMDMYHRVCYYHKDPELARDVAFTLEVFSKEMVFDILGSQSADEMMDRLKDGAEQVLCFLSEDVITRAARYMRKAVNAYGKEMGYEIDSVEDTVETLDFFFEAAKLSKLVDDSGEMIAVKYKPQNTTDDARS